MKSGNFKWIFAWMFVVFAGLSLNAQFDDIYYNPDTDNLFDEKYAGDRYDDYEYYDNDEYDYFDDYDYQYSSRIRRFHRSYRGFGYYDPCYVDSYYYDPFYSNFFFPGSTIYINYGYNDYWSYRRWNRWNRWNRYRYGWSPVSFYGYNYCPPGWGFNVGFGWNRPYYGSYYGSYYSYNSWNYYNNYYNYCPSPISNYYGVNNGTIVNVNNVNGATGNGVVYGPRTTGTIKTSPRGPAGTVRVEQPVFKGDKTDYTAGADRLLDKPSSSDVTNRSKPQSSPVDRGSVRTDVDRRIESPDRVSKRPIYKPSSGSSSTADVDRKDRSTYKPSTTTRENYKPSTSTRGDYRPNTSTRREYKPKVDSYKPSRGSSSKDYYRPSSRSDRPSSYTPSTSSRSNRSYKPSSSSSSRSNRSYTPSSRSSNRSYSPSSRSSGSSRSYKPSSSSRSSSKSYSPSRSSRSSSKSYSPSRSSSSSRSSASRSSSSRSSSSRSGRNN